MKVNVEDGIGSVFSKAEAGSGSCKIRTDPPLYSMFKKSCSILKVYSQYENEDFQTYRIDLLLMFFSPFLFHHGITIHTKIYIPINFIHLQTCYCISCSLAGEGENEAPDI